MNEAQEKELRDALAVFESYFRAIVMGDSVDIVSKRREEFIAKVKELSRED